MSLNGKKEDIDTAYSKCYHNDNTINGGDIMCENKESTNSTLQQNNSDKQQRTYEIFTLNSKRSVREDDKDVAPIKKKE